MQVLPATHGLKMAEGLGSHSTGNFALHKDSVAFIQPKEWETGLRNENTINRLIPSILTRILIYVHETQWNRKLRTLLLDNNGIYSFIITQYLYILLFSYCFALYILYDGQYQKCSGLELVTRFPVQL